MVLVSEFDFFVKRRNHIQIGDQWYPHLIVQDYAYTTTTSFELHMLMDRKISNTVKPESFIHEFDQLRVRLPAQPTFGLHFIQDVTHGVMIHIYRHEARCHCQKSTK